MLYNDVENYHRATAIHEAGHCLVAIRCGWHAEIALASIIPNARGAGRVEWFDENVFTPGHQITNMQLAILAGGYAAEAVLGGARFFEPDNASSDFAQIAKIIAAETGEPSATIDVLRHPMFESAFGCAVEHCQIGARAIRLLAVELQVEKEVDADRIIEICAPYGMGPSLNDCEFQQLYDMDRQQAYREKLETNAFVARECAAERARIEKIARLRAADPDYVDETEPRFRNELERLVFGA